MPFLPYKSFALMGRLKTAKCECLQSRANCQANACEAAPNTRLKQLLAGEKYVYPKAKIVKSLHHYVLSQ